MQFSEYFKVSRTKVDDWFDPILSVDTPLFLDPFLIYAQEKGEFIGSHDEIITFFEGVYSLVAKSNGNTQSLYYQKALNVLLLPEMQELCLGYASVGTKGSGTGKGLAKDIASILWIAIKAGLKEIKHFEEIGILREGMGADRIGDITAGILRHRLISYTAVVCRRHEIPVNTFRYQRGFYDVAQERWRPIKADLPYNEFNEKPIILVPRRYLKSLPTINAEDFWDFCYTNENDVIRNDFNYDVAKNVSKKEIVELARRHPEVLNRYLNKVEERPARPYNFERDEQGLVNWYKASGNYVQNHPLSFELAKETDFYQVVEKMVDEYKHFVEENAGWRLLWNDDGKNKSEKAAQLLFLGIVKHYCRANDIDISPEPNIGRGPVDFKASKGYIFRALIELKLARNSKFWSGLSKQLPTYLKAESINVGHFVVIAYSDNDLKRITNIRSEVKKVNQSGNYNLKAFVVDARPEKPSASKL
jgi:hypothetical protein